MDAVLWIVLLLLVVGGVASFAQTRKKAAARSLDDARAEARRWVERLGGQVYALDPGDDAAARQAIADASERFTAAGSQVEQASTEQQYRLAQQTAYEGLYYVRAARTSLGLDPGPDLPAMPGQQQAGAVTEARSVSVEGREYEASPQAGDSTRHYYPGGMVAGRPVPRGWYSEPWWKPALVAGAWGVGTYLVASSLFAGMAGMGAWGDGGYDAGYEQGLADGGQADGQDQADQGGGTGQDQGDTGDGWGSGDDFSGGDLSGGDFGGGGGFDF